MKRNTSPSRDEFRALRREARREGRAKKDSVSLRPSARDRLNALKDLLKVEDQSMVIDLLYIRLGGEAGGAALKHLISSHRRPVRDVATLADVLMLAVVMAAIAWAGAA